MATNEELIKTMCSDDFNKFLFRFKVNCTANFLESGGRDLNVGSYSFDLNIGEYSYEFQFNVNNNDDNKSIIIPIILQKMI